MNVSDMSLFVVLASELKVAVFTTILLLTRFFSIFTTPATGTALVGFDSALSSTNVGGLGRGWVGS